MLISLIKLTENDKRLIFALLISIILIFVLIGVIGHLIHRLMKWQGKKMDSIVHDVVVSKVIKDKHHLKQYGTKRNWRLFYKQARIGLLIVAISFLALLITCWIRKDFNYNIFDHEKTGFNTLFFLWDFNDPESYTKVFGITVLAKWPPLYNTPHFEVDAIGSYIFVPLFVLGVLWYLIATQSLIARQSRLKKLCSTVFEKTLENYNQNTNVIPTSVPQQSNQNNSKEL